MYTCSRRTGRGVGNTMGGYKFTSYTVAPSPPPMTQSHEKEKKDIIKWKLTKEGVVTKTLRPGPCRSGDNQKRNGDSQKRHGGERKRKRNSRGCVSPKKRKIACTKRQKKEVEEMETESESEDPSDSDMEDDDDDEDSSVSTDDSYSEEEYQREEKPNVSRRTKTDKSLRRREKQKRACSKNDIFDNGSE